MPSSVSVLRIKNVTEIDEELSRNPGIDFDRSVYVPRQPGSYGFRSEIYV